MTRLTTSGDGAGYGYGYGACYGNGGGDGFGYGDGLGEYIGKISHHAVEVIPLWGIVRVGCMVHTLEWWEQHWQQAAARKDIDIVESVAEAMLANARSIIGNNCKS